MPALTDKVLSIALDQAAAWQAAGQHLTVAVNLSPSMLIDDTIRTRWTSTVAGALLADVGATTVLPLVIHQLP